MTALALVAVVMVIVQLLSCLLRRWLARVPLHCASAIVHVIVPMLVLVMAMVVHTLRVGASGLVVVMAVAVSLIVLHSQ